MTLVTPSLVFSKVSIVYTSILIPPTSPLLTQQTVTSITLSVIREPTLMTLDSSTAHMYLSRWYVPLVRTPSSPRLASRPAMVSLLTHSQKEPTRVSALSRSTRTATIVALLLRTSCDPSDTYFSKTSFGGSFFV